MADNIKYAGIRNCAHNDALADPQSSVKEYSSIDVNAQTELGIQEWI